jgi:LacI family transcriptional regulator
LDYEPNTYAINLRTNTSNAFGLIVPVISNFFYHSFVSAIEEEIRKMGYTLLILQSGEDPIIEQENLKLLRMNRVAGIFICVTANTRNTEVFLKAEQSGIPIIFFDKVPEYEAFNKVCVADVEAATIAAETIIKADKKNVLAILGNAELSITKKRRKALLETFEAKAPTIKVVMASAHSFDEAQLQTELAFKDGINPDAIFCMSDEILTGTMKAIQILKLSVPNQVSVIAISNGFIPKLYDPEVTYVETSGYQLGKLAFSRMADYINGRTFVQNLTLPCRLVEGKSI